LSWWRFAPRLDRDDVWATPGDGAGEPHLWVESGLRPAGDGTGRTAAVAAVLALHGALDLRSIAFFRDLMGRVLREGADRVRGVVFDWTALDYLDSSALGVLIGIRREIGRTHGLTLVMPLGMPGRVHQPLKVLRITRLDLLFPCYLSQEEAVRGALSLSLPATGRLP
jgi:anti-anti-sigma factor